MSEYQKEEYLEIKKLGEDGNGKRKEGQKLFLINWFRPPSLPAYKKRNHILAIRQLASSNRKVRAFPMTNCVVIFRHPEIPNMRLQQYLRLWVQKAGIPRKYLTLVRW